MEYLKYIDRTKTLLVVLQLLWMHLVVQTLLLSVFESFEIFIVILFLNLIDHNRIRYNRKISIVAKINSEYSHFNFGNRVARDKGTE